MKTKGALILTLGTLMVVTSGCIFNNTTPVVPITPATPPAQEQPVVSTGSYIEKNRTALQALGEAITEKDISDDIAKMKTKESIKSGTRLKFTGGSASVNALMVEAKEAAKLEEVKAEIKGQYDDLTKISSSIRVIWLDGDATTISLVYYKVGDEAIANKVLAALGGKAVAATTTEPAVTEPKKDETPAVTTGKSAFAVGEAVLANWKAGAVWWDAKVTKVEGSKISVKYTSDNSDDTLDIAAIAHKPTGTAKVSVGDRVVAKWNGGSFYGATVTAISGTTASVDWDDKTKGTAPLSDITFPGK